MQVSMLVKMIYCYSKKNKPENFSQNTSERIWNHYKEEIENGLLMSNAGNHVRVVVDRKKIRTKNGRQDGELKEEVKLFENGG